MALPSSDYFVAFPPQILFRDKDDGTPLSAGYVNFFVDTARTVRKAIYKQVRLPDNTYGFVELTNPVTLTSIGTFGDDDGNDILVYTFPYSGTPETPGGVELYYLEVYSSDDTLQFTREAYPPNVITSGNTTGTFQSPVNAITNPQFADVLFNEDPTTGTYAFSVSTANQETVIAPGWSIITSGTGTVTVKKISVTETPVVGNPPYALQIESETSISDIKLRQRLLESPTLFYNNYINATVTVKGISPLQVAFSVEFTPSSGDSYTPISAQSSTDNGLFTVLSGTVAVNEIENTDTAPDGYVDVDITFTPLTTVQITNAQLVSVANSASSVQFKQQTIAQQMSNLAYYYDPLLEYKPIPSLLTGWDFPLNPAQLGTSGNISGSGAYIWDQTIAARGATNVAYSRNSVSGGLQFITPATTDAFYILQYLTGAQAQEIIATKLSVNMHAYTDGASTVTSRIYLYRATTAASVPTLGTTIGTLASSGVFTVNAAGWTLINRSALGVPIFHLTEFAPSGNTNDYGFSGWQITESSEINDTDKFAIVVTFAHTATPVEIVVDSISVVKGSIPTRPGAQTKDQVLQECQYYYEKSYAGSSAVGSVGTANALYRTQHSNLSVTTLTLYPTPFEFRFNTVKRTTPTLTYYSSLTLNTSATVTAYVIDNAGAAQYADRTYSSSWAAAVPSTKGAYSLPTNATGYHATGSCSTNSNGGIVFHYTADARLGIV